MIIKLDSMTLARLYFLIAVMSVSCLAFADSSSQESFKKGIGAFQKEDFPEATSLFSKSLEASPNNPTVLYNWGLSLYREGQIGLALGAWRRARGLSPFFRPSHEALKHAKETVHSAAFDGEGSDWETVREHVLVHVSFQVFAILTLGFLLFGGIKVLKFLGARKFALLEETPMPDTPLMGFLSLILALCFAALTAGKIYDQLKSRATVVPERVAVYTAPSKEDNQVFELLEGVEVFPLRTEGEWVQIVSIGGLSGWISKDSIYYTSGRKLW